MPNAAAERRANRAVLLPIHPLLLRMPLSVSPHAPACCLLLSPLKQTTLFGLQVYGADSKQERVYKQAIVPIVQEVLDGFNCTIFAYGQTGTGKTFTMEGGPRNSVDGNNLSAEAGIIPRAIKQIFDAIECNQVTDSSVKVALLLRQGCPAVCACQSVCLIRLWV